MKKKYFIAASTFALMANASVRAADIVSPHPEPAHTNAVAPAAFGWEGFYAGAAAGGVWGRVNDSMRIVGQSGIVVNFPVKKSGNDGNKISSPDGFIGGLYAGYNFLAGDILVVGADTDLNWSNAHARFVERNPVEKKSAEIASKQKWVGATRARIGLASDRFMPYIAAGIAYGQLGVTYKYKDANTDGASEGRKEERNFSLDSKGWTAGVGLDYAMTDNLLLRAEYRYTDLGKNTFQVANPVPATHSVRYMTNEVRFGVAYKF